MTRLGIIGLTAALLTASPAWPAALDHGIAASEPIAKGTATQLAFDGPARLPAGLLPEQDRSCVVGERVTISGTIEDVERKAGGWSAGATARADACKGLTDFSTGFAALFGDGGRRRTANGAVAFGLPVRQVTASSRSFFSRCNRSSANDFEEGQR
jgi:hypothetical protein